MSWIKTSRALSSTGEAFRIERTTNDENEYEYDIIFQANGEDEEVAILVDEKDLKNLLQNITSII